MANKAFFHEAMATTYNLKFPGLEISEAEHVATRCFHLLDELEARMSRFIPDSDISRVNKLRAGESMWLEEEVHSCLKSAIEISVATDGYFDIGTAALSDIYRGMKSGLLNDYEYEQAIEQALVEKQEGSLYVNPAEPMVHCFKEGIKIDLGGIGKGFALDYLANTCREQGVTTFCLDAGGSTVLVETDLEDTWEYHLAAGKERKQIDIANGSISASGSRQQGDHIFNPITGQNDERLYDRLWVSADTAMHSDAYATAFFSMEPEQIATVLEENASISWVSYAKKGLIHHIRKSAARSENRPKQQVDDQIASNSDNRKIAI